MFYLVILLIKVMLWAAAAVLAIHNLSVEFVAGLFSRAVDEAQQGRVGGNSTLVYVVSSWVVTGLPLLIFALAMPPDEVPPGERLLGVVIASLVVGTPLGIDAKSKA